MVWTPESDDVRAARELTNGPACVPGEAAMLPVFSVAGRAPVRAARQTAGKTHAERNKEHWWQQGNANEKAR